MLHIYVVSHKDECCGAEQSLGAIPSVIIIVSKAWQSFETTFEHRARNCLLPQSTYLPSVLDNFVI